MQVIFSVVCLVWFEGSPGGAVYQPVTVVTPQGHVMTQAISPGKIHIQNSQVCTSFMHTACTNCLKVISHIKQTRTLSDRDTDLLVLFFYLSIYSCRWIRILVSSVMKTTRLKTSVVSSPNKPPTWCAHGSSSTSRWACQSDTEVNTVIIFKTVGL